MAHPKILPFKAIYYNRDRIGDFNLVVTPPYDVINPEMQAAYYEKSPYNFVRVDLAKQEGEGRYESARLSFNQWRRNRILIQDELPALYFHHHSFCLPGGERVTRKGFFAARRIEDFSEGGIKPHEKTLDAPKADRLLLTRALEANLSPVFSLYSDPEKKIDRVITKLLKTEPFINFETPAGETHRVWREHNPTVCKMVNDILQEQPLFIADGHHRYETSINYRNECRHANPPGDGMEGFNHTLMYLSNLNDEGLVILPIHRALHGLSPFVYDQFIAKVRQHFRLVPMAGATPGDLLARLQAEGEYSHAIAILTKRPEETAIMTISKRAWKTNPVATTVPESLIPLDVCVLHRLILEEILKISPEAQARQDNLIYWKDTEKAINETLKGQCDVTFLLNPTRIEDMQSVALSGEKMPQKSTYFFPKILSGLVVNPLGNSRMGYLQGHL